MYRLPRRDSASTRGTRCVRWHHAGRCRCEARVHPPATPLWTAFRAAPPLGCMGERPPLV
eukprot:4755194-Prymnesium_polylepis.1